MPVKYTKEFCDRFKYVIISESGRTYWKRNIWELANFLLLPTPEFDLKECITIYDRFGNEVL